MAVATSVTLSPGSSFVRSYLHLDADANPYFGLRKRIQFPPRDTDQFHTVISGDRIDTLAYRYLGDPALWWVISDVNNVALPLVLEAGTILRIPSKSRITSLVLRNG